jgi:hypothetical protein
MGCGVVLSVYQRNNTNLLSKNEKKQNLDVWKDLTYAAPQEKQNIHEQKNEMPSSSARVYPKRWTHGQPAMKRPHLLLLRLAPLPATHITYSGGKEQSLHEHENEMPPSSARVYPKGRTHGHIRREKHMAGRWHEEDGVTIPCSRPARRQFIEPARLCWSRFDDETTPPGKRWSPTSTCPRPRTSPILTERNRTYMSMPPSSAHVLPEETELERLEGFYICPPRETKLTWV